MVHPPVLWHIESSETCSKPNIAEAWDAGGLYQIVTFLILAEWNALPRRYIRRFVKGGPGLIWSSRLRLLPEVLISTNSKGICRSTASISIICHDGFTPQ